MRGKPAALTASVVVHLGALVAGGHALSASNARLGMAEREIQVELLPEAPAEAPFAEEPAPAVPRATTFPQHKHDYPVAPSHDDQPHDPALVHAPLAPAPVDATPVARATPVEPAT